MSHIGFADIFHPVGCDGDVADGFCRSSWRRTDESLTAHGGLALFGEYLRAMGVGRLD